MQDLCSLIVERIQLFAEGILVPHCTSRLGGTTPERRSRPGRLEECQSRHSVVCAATPALRNGGRGERPGGAPVFQLRRGSGRPDH